MVQKLLADRFQLKFHGEKRELSVYAIQLAKGGPKLTPAAHPDAESDQEGQRPRHRAVTVIYHQRHHDRTSSSAMQFFFDRPLVDQTGLGGKYDITLRYTHDEANATDPNAPPGLFTAAQEQLGLKFEPTKAPVDVFVIDHVEKPSAN